MSFAVFRCALLCSLLALVLAAFPVAAEYAYKATAHGGIELVDMSVQKILPPPDEVLETDTITFNIIYEDAGTGFNDPADGQMRRGRLHDALEYVAEALGRSGTLDVLVEASLLQGGNTLAVGGTFFGATPGFQKPTSLRRLETGVKPFGNSEEITILVDFAHNWHFGAAPPGPGQLDFLSTLIHEVLHGMGFLSFMNSDGSSRLSPGVYTFYDQFMGHRVTGELFFDGNANFLSDGNELNSNVLGYVNDVSTTIYDDGGLRIPMFSPPNFIAGTSFSHVDVGAVAGNPVMTHFISAGVAKRFFSTADLGVLRVIGYPQAVVDPGTLSFLGEGGGEGEGGEGGVGEGDLGEEGEAEEEGEEEEQPQGPKFLFCGASDTQATPGEFMGDIVLIVALTLVLLLVVGRRNPQKMGVLKARQ